MTELLFIIVFAFGIFLGWWVGTTLAARAFSDLLIDLGVNNKTLTDLAKKNGIEVDETTDEEPQESINVVVEKHGEQLYAFRKENDEFLGQGADRDALLARLAERFQNVKLTINQAEGAEYLQKP